MKYSWMTAACAGAAMMVGTAVGAHCDGVCANPAVAGNYSIELLGVEADGTLVTFEWQVCKLQSGEGNPGLSHWNFAVSQIACLGEGVSVADLVVAATLDVGEGEVDILDKIVIGLDGSTGFVGLKFDIGFECAPTPCCATYTITFDISLLNEGWTLGSGCIHMVTKGGNVPTNFFCGLGPVCVFVPPPPPEVEFEGCSHGYWGSAPHADWDGTDYLKTTKIGTIFGPSAYANSTFAQALAFTGGPGVLGGQRILLRNAVASLLNAAHPDVLYFFDEAEVIALVNAALATGNRNAMLELEGELDDLNNLGSALCGFPDEGEDEEIGD